MTRVYLFALMPGGKRPESFGAVMHTPPGEVCVAPFGREHSSVRGDLNQGEENWYHPTYRQGRAMADALSWWLVECESAEAGREIINPPPRFHRSGLANAEPRGRILDSGGAR
jgi:hypothetical protein